MIEQLITEWKRTKAALSRAQEEHLQSEINLYNAVKDDLPDKGTYHAGDITITCGFTEKWDEVGVSDALNSWPDNVKFPFNTTWKPDTKAVSYIRDNMPELYKVLSNALTITPKKPSFTTKGK